ncbi:MAG: A/G-specific adenine glycosylase [Burkholderiaceae bacterium]|nr:A/G-specific adenine glycosylase [Burkholderiaceae bacterium]
MKRRPGRRQTAGEPGAVAAVGLAADVIAWQRAHGRHALPWQQSTDPYLIWLSEVMLQQTQVATVIPYYEAFLRAFPTVADLARAPADRVMAAWSGLGYYSRARNLQAAARLVVERHGGVFPAEAAALEALPGIGRSTAAAIAVFAFGSRNAILDGNVKRVFARVFRIEGHTGEAAVERRLWAHAEAEMPPPGAPVADLRAYTQGLMDLGATVCTRSRPQCPRCPLHARCAAYAAGVVERHPAPRPRRVIPVREFDLLLAMRGHSVLLQERPPTGIWGGLWSLPELDRAAPEAGLARAGLALPREPLQEVARFEHAFTHFRMKARVWGAEVGAESDHRATVVARDGPPLHWLPIDEAATAPLPRPVRTLLETLSEPIGRA